jgi:hypothetical protein
VFEDGHGVVLGFAGGDRQGDAGVGQPVEQFDDPGVGDMPTA